MPAAVIYGIPFLMGQWEKMLSIYILLFNLSAEHDTSNPDIVINSGWLEQSYTFLILCESVCRRARHPHLHDFTL